MFGGIVAMLLNQATNRYHPVVFAMAPLPGGHTSEGGERYKTRGHHTTGFESRDEAVAFAEKEYVARIPGGRPALGGDILWDGQDTPAMSIFFGTVNGELRPLF